MRRLAALAFAILFSALPIAAQNPPAPGPKPPDDYSGTYAFLQEGEFVQITIEEEGKVTGFVSRFGGEDNERGAFLDHFFKSGKLDGNNLSFTTSTVHGVWYEFKGAVQRGQGKNIDEEGYYVLKGTLIENRTDAARKTTTKSREVAFKSFPQDLGEGSKKQPSP